MPLMRIALDADLVETLFELYEPIGKATTRTGAVETAIRDEIARMANAERDVLRWANADGGAS